MENLKKLLKDRKIKNHTCDPYIIQKLRQAGFKIHDVSDTYDIIQYLTSTKC